MTFLSDYLNKMDIPSHISLNPSVELLNLVVNQHVTTIPYENSSIFLRDPDSCDLSRDNLQRTLLSAKRAGGMCYATSELLYYALSELNFHVQRIPVFPLNNKPFNPKFASTHNILHVEIEDKKYLIDVGYGYNSIRVPIVFEPDLTSVSITSPYEKYQLQCHKDHYQLNMQIKNEWFSLYRFDRPLEFIDAKQTVENYKNLLHCT